MAELVDEDGRPEEQDDSRADFQIIQNFSH